MDGLVRAPGIPDMKYSDFINASPVFNITTPPHDNSYTIKETLVIVVKSTTLIFLILLAIFSNILVIVRYDE